jgi:hypothetical protein
VDDTHIIQFLAVLGLIVIALFALVVAYLSDDSQTAITITGVAIGGIAGFLTHKGLDSKSGGAGKTQKTEITQKTKTQETESVKETEPKR